MSKYSIGIDLGTTHSALSYFPLGQAESRGGNQSMLPIPQLTAPGSIEKKDLLPSFAYLASDSEFEKDLLKLPWGRPAAIVGEFARSHGAKSPTRLVSSAKSWLSHAGVDRTAPILPWQAPADVTKISPVEASARYLEYIREAWDHEIGTEKETAFEKQQIVLTVPASFDAGARELTLRAAKEAGYPEVTLLEEPQAAFYAWVEALGPDFRKQTQPGEVILVVDVGGGTSDFSLIAISDSGGDLEVTRLAVGEHILLGGDNMDLALAVHLRQKLVAAGKTVDAWQFNALTFACRQAKEEVFSRPDLKKFPVAVPSRGSSLIGGALKTELLREELEQVLTDGFFPRTKSDELPLTARRTGLAQMSLPFATDAAITRQLAAFLTRQKESLSGKVDGFKPKGKAFIHPSAILFNGGVFKAAPLKERLLEVVNSWITREGGAAARELPGADYDLAVARGAAYYGWVRQGHGIRIRGGTARAYYVGIESSMPAVPGYEPPVKALCVAPFGMEEGTSADIPPQEFGLVVGEPASFRFFSSTQRRNDKSGDMLDDVSTQSDLEELPPIETSLKSDQDGPGSLIPVNIQAAVTELGTLEVRCLERGGKRSWKLEMNVRMH